MMVTVAKRGYKAIARIDVDRLVVEAGTNAEWVNNDEYGERWEQKAILDGKYEATMEFYFTTDELEALKEEYEQEYLEADQYPWDDDHIAAVYCDEYVPGAAETLEAEEEEF